MLLCTIPAYLPNDLHATRRGLGVLVLRQPAHLDGLLDALGGLARRTPAEDEPAG